MYIAHNRRANYDSKKRLFTSDLLGQDTSKRCTYKEGQDTSKHCTYKEDRSFKNVFMTNRAMMY